MIDQLCDNNLSYKAKIVLILCSLVLPLFIAFTGLQKRPIANHEGLVAVTAREMLNTGNWVVPKYNGNIRLHKTPLCYWLVAATGKITGRLNEFAVRLPSALLAVLSAGAILFFVNKWMGLRIAVLASAIWSTSLGFIRYSHSARPEMALCCFVTIAMLSFYSGLTSPSRKEQIRYMIIFWISFALAMLAKGPAPILLIGPALLLYFAVFREWKKITKTLPIIGTLIFLIIVLPWPIMIALKDPQALLFWKTQFIDRATGDLSSGNEPIYYYLEVMFILFVPWVAFLPLALTAPFFRIWGKKQNTMLYLWLWFVASIVAMTLCKGKRRHYILPAMPAVAILSAIIFEDMVFRSIAYTKKFSKNFLSGHLIVLSSLAVTAIVWAIQTGNEFKGPIIILSSLSIVMLIVIVFLFRYAAKITACICIIVTIAIISVLGLTGINNQHSKNYIIRTFAEKVVKKIGPDSQLIAYCNVDADFVYYFGKDVPEIPDLDEVYDFYNNGVSVFAKGVYLNKLKADTRFKIAYISSDDKKAVFNKNVKN